MNYSYKLKSELDKIIKQASKNTNYFRNPISDFSRKRKLNFYKVFLAILSMGGNSLDHELLELHNYSTATPSKSAFVQARNKIIPEASKHVFKKFSSLLHKPQHLNKYRLMAIDGTSLKIFRNPNDKDSFVPNKTHKGHNALTLSAMYDLLNHIYTDAVIQSFNVNYERGALISMLSNVDANSIIVADRGYESYNVFAHIEKSNLKYVVRIKDIYSNGILSGFDLPDEEFDKVITVNISNFQRKEFKDLPNYRFSPSIARFDFSTLSNPVYTLDFRVVRIKLPSGKYESIATNLTSDFTIDEIKHIYGLRWGIETSFRHLKYAIGLSNFHSKKRESISQEIYSRLILYNFCESVVQHSILKKMSTKHTYIINFTRAVQICRKYLKVENTISFNIDTLIKKYLSIVRKGRSYERALKTKPFTSFIYRVA